MDAPYTKTILCLANSRKRPSGRCIAGKEMLNERADLWIRPVSNRKTKEISDQERRYKDGSYPEVLDIISIPMIKPQPKTFQSENHLIDPEHCWIRKGRSAWQQALTAVDQVDGPLWINGNSSYNGINDRIDAESANTLGNSLFLIQPTELRIIVQTEGESFGNPRRRIRAQYLQGDNGIFAVEMALVCVSLVPCNTYNFG